MLVDVRKLVTYTVTNAANLADIRHTAETYSGGEDQQ